MAAHSLRGFSCRKIHIQNKRWNISASQLYRPPAQNRARPGRAVGFLYPFTLVRRLLCSMAFCRGRGRDGVILIARRYPVSQEKAKEEIQESQLFNRWGETSCFKPCWAIRRGRFCWRKRAKEINFAQRPFSLRKSKVYSKSRCFLQALRGGKS